jgi:lysophospholipase L1-like esterase
MNSQLIGMLLTLLHHVEPVVLPPPSTPPHTYQPPPPSPPKEPPSPPKETVVCFGDSITAGYKATGYPGYLQAMTSTSFTIVNAGVGGEDTRQGMGRMWKVLAANKPKYVVIMEGANDVVEGLSPSTTSYDLENMAQQVRATGGVPIMSTITPNTASQNYVPENYNPSIKWVAYKGGFTLVDTYSRMAASWRSISFDGLHPNDTGSKMIADGFAEALAKEQSK